MVVSGVQPSTCWSEARTSTGSGGTRRHHLMWSMKPSRLISLRGFEIEAQSTRTSFEPPKHDARLSQIPPHAGWPATRVRK
jgi:hypothetical protein